MLSSNYERPRTGQDDQRLTLTHINSLTLSGPLALSLTSLPAGVTLANANGGAAW